MKDRGSSELLLIASLAQDDGCQGGDVWRGHRGARHVHVRAAYAEAQHTDARRCNVDADRPWRTHKFA